MIATPPGGGSSAHCAACDVTTASHTYLLDVNIFISRIQAKQIPFSSVQFRNVLQCNRHGSLVGNFPDATKYNMRLLKCFAVVLTLLRDKGRFKLACYPGFLKSTIFFRTVSYAVYFDKLLESVVNFSGRDVFSNEEFDHNVLFHAPRHLLFAHHSSNSQTGLNRF